MKRFDLHSKYPTACLHAVGPDASSTGALLLSLSTIAGTKISNPPWVNFQSAGWVSFQSAPTPLSLILVDVDYFKRYNDQYGHQAGDGCLKSIAQALAETVRRPYDLVARYGGEEFACVLPNTVLSGAVDIAEKMQKRVRALGIEHSASDVDRVMTISLGVATLTPAGEQGFETLIEAADKQLYEAKNAGRARVCSSAMSSS